MLAITTIALPIFLIIGAGFVLRRTNVIKEEWFHVLNSFVYHVALPALIIAGFWSIRWTTPGLLKFVGVNLLFLIGFAVVLGIGLAVMPINRRIKASLFLAAMVGNSIYMGFPLGEQAFGPEALDRVVGIGTLFMVAGILISIIAVEVFWRPDRLSGYLKNFMKNPLGIGVVLGIVASLLGADGWLMGVVRESITLVAAAASPAALLALGSFLYGRFEREVVWFAAFAAAVKLFAFPALIFFVDVLAGGGVREVGTSMLLAAMPTAAAAFTVAEEFDLEMPLVATTLVMSTVGSIFTVPLILAIWV